MKRTLSIFLCLVMLLGILPLTAFAATTITVISPYIPDKYLPYIGRNASAAVSSSYNSNYISIYDSECYASAAVWKDSAFNNFTGQFEEDPAYCLVLTLKANSGYVFGDKSVTSMDYDDCRGYEYVKRSNTEAELRIWFDSIRVYTNLANYFGSSYSGYIPKVEAPSIPTTDMTKDQYLAQVKLSAEDSKYLTLTDLDLDGIFSDSNKFQSGETYMVSFSLEVKEAMKKQARFDPELSVVAVEYGNVFQEVGYFPFTDSAYFAFNLNDVVDRVTKVSISGLERPVVGSAPQTTGFTIDNDNLELRFDSWREQGGGSVSVFQEGKTYLLRLLLSAKDVNTEIAIPGPSGVWTNAGSVIAAGFPEVGNFYVDIQFKVGADMGTYTFDLRSGPVEYVPNSDVSYGWFIVLLGGYVDYKDSKVDLDKDGIYDLELFKEDDTQYLRVLDGTKLSGTYVIDFSDNQAVQNLLSSGGNVYTSFTFIFPGEPTPGKDLGNYVFDFSKGDLLFDNTQISWREMRDLVLAGFIPYTMNNFDLDGDGHFDLLQYPDGSAIYVKHHPSSNIKDYYTFTLPQAAKDLYKDGEPYYSSLTFKFTSAPINPFVDVKEGAYYYDAVLWAVNHDPQITNGVDPTHFGPNQNCTRGQVVTFLWRAVGSPEPASSSTPFTDVSATAFYYQAVLWAVENEITNGLSTTSFGPGRSCTRVQVVTFLWRTEGKPAVSGSNPFTDVKSTDYYYEAVLWAVKNNVTNGMSATTFAPTQTCTRGQIVTFLYRAFGPKG